MSNHLVIALLLVCLVWSTGWSQSAEEAFELTQSGPYGTARSMATMNSLDALGADLSAVIANPAGLANFRRSEFTFTTGLEIFRNESQVLSTRGTQQNNAASVQLDQMGLVITSKSRKNWNWKQFNFGFNYQKLETYQKEYGFSDRTLGSISESFLERANGLAEEDLNPFYEGLAFGNVLLFDEQNPGSYAIDLPENASIEKTDEYELSGSSRTNTFSFGANYNNNLLMGINLSFPAFRYEMSQNYRENDPGDEYPIFQSLDFVQNGISRGNGINAQLGLIYNINRALRISASSQTPTRYSVEITSFTADLNYRIVEQGLEQDFESLSPDQFFEYKLNTPWQHRFGIGSIIKKKGFVSASVMYRDYSQLKYDFGDNEADQMNEAFENARIEELFSDSWTIGVGGEYRLTDIFNVRAGVGLTTSASESLSDVRRYSGGFGWRWKNFYLDLAYLYEASTEDNYLPYQSNLFPVTQVEQSNQNHRVDLTIGFKI